MRVSKKDWDLFRKKLPLWQEAYMNRMICEYIEILREDSDASERFWKLDERLREDKKRKGVKLRLSRENVIMDIATLIYDGAVNMDSLDEFSNELKDAVSFILELNG